MKRLFLLLIVLSLTLSAFGASAQEQESIPLSDLTTLAAYAPENTAVFASIRIDAGYFDTLSGVLATISANLPEGTIPPVNLNELLMSQVPPELYAALGDTAALYIPSLEVALMGASENPAIIAFTVKDQAAVDAFLQPMLDPASYIRSEMADGTIFYENSYRYEASYLITGDALLFGVLGRELSEVVTPGEDLRNLSQTDVFAATINNLPGDGYNFVAYLNPSNLIQVAAAFLPALVSEDDLPIDLSQIDPAELAVQVGQFAVAGVIYDQRSLVLDLASTGTFFAEMPAPAVDLTLLDRVPMDAPLLIQGTGLGDVALALMDGIDLLDALVLMSDPTAYDESGAITLSNLGNSLRLGFEGTFNLDFEGTLSTLNGDFVSYITTDFTGDENTNTLSLGVDGIIRTSNVENTQALLDEVAAISVESFAPATYENGVLTIPLGALVRQVDALTITAALADDLLIFGDPGDVAFALNPSDGLTSTATFQYEATHFLPATSTVWYVDTTPLLNVVTGYLEANAATMNPYDLEDLAQAKQLLSLFDSATITASGPAIRLTLTLKGQ